jgi:8-oxo-dGTP pyrophosphatase MutT (NUDIX family)
MDTKTSITKVIIFGSPEPNAHYTDRRAAYIVIVTDGKVATVKSQQKYFLPGDGSLPGEAPEETVAREVREELARRVGQLRGLGEAIQYFYSPADDRHYKMRASFFAGQFTDEPCEGPGEHGLHWLPLTEAEQAWFHACHAWAVRQA